MQNLKSIPQNWFRFCSTNALMLCTHRQTADRGMVWCTDCRQGNGVVYRLQTGEWCGVQTTDRGMVWCTDYRQGNGMMSRRQGEGGWKFPDGSVERVPVAVGGVLHALQPAASPPHPDAAHRPQPVLQAEELQDSRFLRSTPAGTGAQARRCSAGWFAQQVGLPSRLVCPACC